MKNLGTRDLKDVLQVSRTALQCSRVDELRKEVLSLLERVFETGKANFFLSHGSGQGLNLDHVIHRGIDDHFLAQFRQYYYGLDPFPKRFPPVHVSVQTTEQITSYEELVRGEYYNDFLRPQSIHYQMVIYLKSGSRVLGLVALFRPQNSSSFSSRDRAKAELMAPYLAGALEKTIVLEQIIRNQEIINSIVGDLPYRGIMVLDESLEPIFINENAVKMMSRFCKGQGCLEISPSGLPKEISTCCQELKASTCPMESAELHQQWFKVKCGSAPQIWVRLRLIPHDGNSQLFLIYLEPEEPTLDQRLSKLGLTRRELEIACLLVRGLKNAEMASKLYISEYTVENHLKSIYEKLGVRNRTSLVYRLIQLTQSRPWIPI